MVAKPRVGGLLGFVCLFSLAIGYGERMVVLLFCPMVAFVPSFFTYYVISTIQ